MASCTMPIKDVGELVNALENAGELKRISAQVDPDLEIAEILRRTMYAKGPAIGAPKIYTEYVKPKGTRICSFAQRLAGISKRFTAKSALCSANTCRDAKVLQT